MSNASSAALSNVSPITCHVLDTTTGRPAASLRVTLTLLQPSHGSPAFTATTDADGRVKVWTKDADPSVGEVLRTAGDGASQTIWALKFDTGNYFGDGKTFFPEVEVRFFVKTGPGEHYHVPLLLGPWSYTTYRGS
ncbi:MAG: hypothetical protein M1837_000111 [Sclerophora amabilis]|nr:MAG: hypothetical protein M1837_000111 [Sclerophora amabilis]